MKYILSLLLLFSFLLNSTLFGVEKKVNLAQDIAQLVANPVYQVDTEQLEITVKSIVNQNDTIQGIEIKDANANEKINLQLMWKHQFQFAGYYIAKEKGFYKEKNIDVDIKEYDFGMDVSSDVLMMKSQFGVGRSSLIYDKLEGRDITIISSIFQHTPVVLLSKKRDDIKSILDIKNKSIMLSGDKENLNATNAILVSVNAMLLSYGIKPDEYINLSHSFNIDDLISGKTDLMFSYISTDPFYLEKRNIPYQIFSSKDYGFDFYSDILFTSKKLANNNPKLVSDFKEASLKGWQYAIDNIEETVDLILSKYNTQKKSKEALIFEANAIVKLIDIDNFELGDVDSNRIKQIAQTYRLMGMTTQNNSISDVVFKNTISDIIMQKNVKFNIDNFINKISPVIAVPLYNVDTENLSNLLQSYLHESQNIQAIEIRESIADELVFRFYKKDNKFVFNKDIPSNKFKNLYKTKKIFYSGEEVGVVKVYYTNSNKKLIGLTKEEKKWIETHTVKIGVEQWAPVVFSNDRTDIDGIAGDFTKRIIEATGLKVKIINDNWDKLLTDFKDKRIDILPATYYTDKRAKYGLYSDGYFAMKDYIYVKQSTKDISSLEDINGKTLAIVKGYGTIDKVEKMFPNINIVLTKDLSDSINRVLNGKVDALYDGQIAVEKKINDELIKGLKGISQNSFEAAKLHYFSKIDEPILQSILQKALKSISYVERNDILNRWISNKSKLLFTQDEQKWLDKQQPITYVYDPDWAPFEWSNELEQHTGIISDILHKISQSSGIKFTAVPTNSWKESIKKMKNHEVDMYSAVVQNDEREKYAKFTTKNIYSTPAVIVSRTDDDTIYLNIQNALETKTVGLADGYAISDYVKQTYPNLKFKTVKNIQEGFEKLQNKKIDVFVLNAATAQYFIKKKGYSDTRIATKLDFRFDLKIAIQKDMPDEILSILDKAIDNISEKELNDIYYKWTNVKVSTKTDWKLLGEIGLVVLLIFLFILWNMKKLKSMVNAKTAEIRMLLNAFDKNVIASKTDKNGIITYVSEAFCDISGYTQDELMGKSHKIIRHPDMKDAIFKDMWETIKADKVWKGEVKNLKKDGSFYWVETIITPECNSEGSRCGYSAIRQDITDKKEVEDLTDNLEITIQNRTQELNDEKNFTNTIMDSQDNFVITSDGKCIKQANKSFYDFYNIKSVEEFLQKYGNCICDTFDKNSSAEYVHKDMSGESWLDYINRKHNEVHKVIINKDGKDYIFSITSQKLTIKGMDLKTAIFTDITQMEEAKKDVEQILTNILLPVLITNKKNRTIVYANKYAEQQYEKTLDEIVGSHIDDIYTIKGQHQHIIDAITKYGFIENFEEIFKTSTGKEFTALLSVTPISYKDEDCYIGMVTDISKQKEMENEIRAIHKHTRESIEYASLIQGALLPEKSDIVPFFKDSFVIWHPKDTVGGDIWLFNELRHKDECLLMFIDCTGHGVPGAFVTMIVKSIEREIVSKIIKNPEMDISPAIIMAYFNKTMKKLLKQETKESLSNAGWDGGIIYYNKRSQILKFAGAETPLFYMTNDGELKIVKGNRYSVGYKKCDSNYEYKETILEVEEGMKFYCTTDGYIDQNGGEKDFPFGKKRFGNIIKEYHEETMADQQEVFLYELAEYEEMIVDNDRNDDVTVIAFEIGKKSDDKENKIIEIVKYEGVMTQNVIASCMDNIESKITHIGTMSTISTITVEYCQNMMNYSRGIRKDDIHKIVPAGVIEVQYINEEYYNITATNIVSISDKEKIEPKLIEIQSLDKTGIKKRYRELRKSGQNTHEKGGGIGMYEIAKISDSIEYSFEIIREDKYYFTMKSLVKPKIKEKKEDI